VVLSRAGSQPQDEASRASGERSCLGLGEKGAREKDGAKGCARSELGSVKPRPAAALGQAVLATVPNKMQSHPVLRPSCLTRLWQPQAPCVPESGVCAYGGSEDGDTACGAVCGSLWGAEAGEQGGAAWASLRACT